jgi:hypothetical protein
MVSFSAILPYWRKTRLLILIAPFLVLAACNDSKPAPANESANPPKTKTNEFASGRFALQKMLPAAHLWAGDAAPIELSATATTTSNGHEGKAGTWRAVFASPGRQKAEPFIWSGMVDASSTIDHGVEDSYNSSNRSTQTWDVNFLKVDTDQAFAVAQEHGGKRLLEKEPQLGVNYLLNFNARANQLSWHVIYGGNTSMGKLTVVVDASTGHFIHKE